MSILYFFKNYTGIYFKNFRNQSPKIKPHPLPKQTAAHHSLFNKDIPTAKRIFMQKQHKTSKKPAHKYQNFCTKFPTK